MTTVNTNTPCPAAVHPAKQGMDRYCVRCSTLADAGNVLLRSIVEMKERIGCGCGGDYGLCNLCSKTDDESNKAMEVWRVSLENVVRSYSAPSSLPTAKIAPWAGTARYWRQVKWFL